MAAPNSSLREQGLQALREGNLDRAIDLLARAVMADDQDAEAKALLGVSYSQKGLHNQAKRALQTALELQPRNPNYQFNLGVALERAGDQQGAAIAFRDTLQLQRDHPQARAKLQAMGPQAPALLAGVPTMPHTPAAVPPPGVPSMAATQPGDYGTPTAPTAGGFGAFPQPGGRPGTVRSPNCAQWTRPGLSCEFCSGALRPASPVPPPPGPSMYSHTPAAGYYERGGPGAHMLPSMDVGEAFWRRLGAQLLDNLLFLVPLLLAVLAVGSATSGSSDDKIAAGLATFYIGLYLVVLPANFIYGGAMLSRRGQTLGKMATGVRVVAPDGGNPGFWRGAFREILGKGISGAICIVLGYIWMLWDPQQQTWHDKIFDTHVVRA